MAPRQTPTSCCAGDGRGGMCPECLRNELKKLFDELGVAITKLDQIRAGQRHAARREEVMAQFANLNEAIAGINDATNQNAAEISEQSEAINGVATKVQELRDALANGNPATPEQLAALGGIVDSLTGATGVLDANTERLKAIAADPENPVPPVA